MRLASGRYRGLIEAEEHVGAPGCARGWSHVLRFVHL
jgi:hypothetical protein